MRAVELRGRSRGRHRQGNMIATPSSRGELCRRGCRFATCAGEKGEETCEAPHKRSIRLGRMGPSNKGMKLTKPGELRSFAAYPRCSADSSGVRVPVRVA